MAYTGRFKVKFSIQQRLVRGQHADAHFASHQFKLMKEMAVHLKEHSVMICVDDKAVVPIGEPELPMSTGVRPRNKSLVPVGSALVAADHDFHVAGAIPSVLFHVCIPNDSKDSFHKGQIHVTLKDNVFQPSCPMKHSAENAQILREINTNDGLDLGSPILFLCILMGDLIIELTFYQCNLQQQLSRCFEFGPVCCRLHCSHAKLCQSSRKSHELSQFGLTECSFMQRDSRFKYGIASEVSNEPGKTR